MRVNVYSEELEPTTDEHGDRITLVHKNVVSGVQHSAIEILIGKRNIHTKIGNEVDDDSSAIKFWFSNETDRELLVAIFKKALEELARPEARKAQ